jgi:hypothetical protein
MVKISYAICVCNEDRELNSLVNFLLKVKDEEDEVNILVDSTNVTPEVRKVLTSGSLTESFLIIGTITLQSARVTTSL